jgi:hypothetical protein
MNSTVWLKVILLQVIILLATSVAHGQTTAAGVAGEQQTTPPQEDQRTHGLLISAGGGLNFTAGDLADRFGNFAQAGAGVWYKTRGNFIFGIDGWYLFGSQVKENALKGLTTADGYALDINGGSNEVRYAMRGMNLMGRAGFIINAPIGKKAGHGSGIIFTAGAGYLEHRINYQDLSRNIPQLQGEYVKGYDRLTTGFATGESVGYLYLSKTKTINFMLSLEALQGYTRNIRYNFDLQGRDSQSRFDQSYGIKLQVFIPIYGQREGEYYYY